MGFILEGLDAEAYDRSYSDRQLIGRIISYFRPHVSLMLSVAGLIVLNSAMDTAFPVLISQSIDTIVTDKVMQTAIWLVVFILLAAVFSWTCNLFRQWFTARAVGNVVLQLRKDAFSSV